jgi:hypothetical protein
MRQQAWWTVIAVVLVAATAQAQVIRGAICMTQVT